MTTAEVWEGDCLTLLANVPEASIPLVLTDLPYGTTASAWDIVIPLAPLWSHFERVLAPGGVVVLTAAQPFTSELVQSRRSWYRDEWIWEKPQGTGHLNCEQHPLRSHESLLVFSQTGAYTYNPQWEQGEPYSAFLRRSIDTTTVYGKQSSMHSGSLDGRRYPKTVLRFAQEREGLHPNQKPVPLMAYMIRTYSNPGDLVLDCTCGSGTTGVAAIQERRNFIGIELDPVYAARARRRIVETPPLLDLFTMPAESAAPRQEAMVL